MPPPTIPDPSVIEAAKHERTEAIIHGTLFFGALAQAGALAHSAFPSFGPTPKIVHGGTGFHVDPAHRLRPATPTKAILLYFAPAPVGVVPPESYGLSPNYMKSVAPSLPESAMLATQASPARLKLFELEEHVEKIIRRTEVYKGNDNVAPLGQLVADLVWLKSLPDTVGFRLLEKNRDTAAIELIERALVKRGIDPNAITPFQIGPIAGALLTGAAQQISSTPPNPQPVTPAPPVPVPAPVPQSTFGTNEVAPITLLALGIQLAARGIARELVTEANDP